MKNFLSIFLAALMILTLIACDGTTNKGNANRDDIYDNDSNNDVTDDDTNTSTNDNTESNTNSTCITHNYIDNFCSVCGCSLWSGETDTSWYNVIDLEFTISTADQLAGLIEIVNNGSNLENVKITLSNHIDMNGKSISPIGATPENVFSGEFDGSGYSICNIIIDENSIILSAVEGFGTYYTAYSGLFGYVDGNIFNLNVKQLHVNINSETIDSLYIGGIAAYNQGNIKNCSIQGKIETKLSGTIGRLCVGGISSTAYGSIVKCSSDISIIADINSENRLECYLAGITGYSSKNSITQCCSKGSISLTTDLFANLHMGGLVGSSYMSDIANCYSTVDVSASVMNGHGAVYYAGGLLGNMEKGNVKSCYSTGNVSLNCPELGYAGALIGYIRADYFSSVMSTISVSDSFAIGNVHCNCKTENPEAISATIGQNADKVITNCYYLANQVITGDKIVKDGTPANQNDLTNIAFYKNRMLWDSDIWNLKDGTYPTLK